MVTLDAHLLALDMKTGAIVWDVTLQDYTDRLRLDDCAARRQGQSHRRRRRRRVRDPRIHRRVRRADGQARMALLHDSRAGRAGPRDVGGRFVEDRRRRRLGHRRVRSGAESRCSTEPAIPVPTITARAAKATTCTAPRSWRSTPTPASSAGTISSRRTTCTTGTRREVPVLADITVAGQPRKVVMFANRNGFYYTLDRTTGKVIVGEAVRDDDMGERDRPRRPARDCCRATRPTKKARSPVPTSPAAPTSGRPRSIRPRGPSSSTRAKRA